MVLNRFPEIRFHLPVNPIAEPIIRIYTEAKSRPEADSLADRIIWRDKDGSRNLR